MIDRRRVRDAFGRQADAYDANASVQKRVVGRFLDLLKEERLAPRRLLDVGCGTGMLLGLLHQEYEGCDAIGVDLARGMCRKTRENLQGRAGIAILTADAESLPFCSGSFDLVVSTSTYQWLGDLSIAFREALRMLVPGGTFFFTMFGEATLHELRSSYRLAATAFGSEQNDRTHNFPSAAQVVSALEGAGFDNSRAESEFDIERHRDVPCLLRSLKSIGAGNASPGASRGLAERGVMLKMMKIYEEHYGDEDCGIPATYEIVYGMGTRPGGIGIE